MKKLFHQDERGLAQAALILIIVAVLAAVGFVGYRVLNKDKKSSPQLSSQDAKKIEAECKQEIDDQDFCKFTSSFTAAEAYTAVMETSGANGSSTTTLKVDGDDSQMTVTDGGNVAADYITIGNATYIKDITDGKWTKTTSQENETANLKEDIGIDFDESDVPEAERTEYKNLGKEACGNLTCFKYQVIDPTAEAGEEQFIWFDDDDYLLRKWTFSGGEGTTTMTLSYDGVSIKEPSPIKE